MRAEAAGRVIRGIISATDPFQPVVKFQKDNQTMTTCYQDLRKQRSRYSLITPNRSIIEDESDGSAVPHLPKRHLAV